MSSQLTKGTQQPIRQPDEREWTRESGWLFYHVWMGTKMAIETLAASMPGRGYDNISVSCIENNVVWKVRGTRAYAISPDVEVPTFTWELTGTAEQFDLLNHPIYQGLTKDVRDSIAEALEKDPSKTSDTTIDSWGTNGATIYRMKRIKQESFLRSQPILRYTATASTRKDINFSMANIEKVHTFAQLPAIGVDFINITQALSKIERAGAPWSVPTNFTWGWLKYYPTITQTLRGKTQLTQEWQLHIWPNLIYPNAT